MCSRFVLKSSPKSIANLFNLEKTIDWKQRYNIAPSQAIPAVIRPLENKKREIKLIRWGFVASWIQGGRLILNIRSEEIGEKPFFQESFEKWRCLVPVDGFYIWRHEAKETHPYYFHMKNDAPFAMAGLWATQKFEDKDVDVCAILTTVPNDTVRAFHDRMPVIVAPSDYRLWLDSADVRDFEKLEKLFQPFPGNQIKSYQVGAWVNNVAHDDEKCIEPSSEPETISFPF